MEVSVQQGINAELNHILKPGWSQRLELEHDRFRVVLPEGAADKASARAELVDEVWRIARFVAYSNFASIGKNLDGSYVLKSHMPSGIGYEIIFDPNS